MSYCPNENTKIVTIDDLIAKVSKVNPDADTNLIRLAYDFAETAHEGQVRKSGEPYIQHPLHTAMILADWGLDDTTIVAGLLHDVPEDTKKSLKDVEKEFGKEIRYLVEGITKLGRLKYRGMKRYMENLRRMFVAMARDIRTILIKFADRLHNIQTIEALPPEKQKRIALETLEIYAAIANRLGMGELRGALQDAAFPYVDPKEYAWVCKKIRRRVEEDQKTIDQMIEIAEKELKEHSMVRILSMHGRTKHLYSLYLKLLNHNRDLSKVYDLIALRIVVESVEECYTVLGLVHHYWRPLKGRIKDYISTPKPNGYQSLHTTVWGPGGKIVEVQIRTRDMHEQAEYGIAAHWHYKESTDAKPLRESDKTLWIQQLLKLHKEAQNEEDYLDSLKLDVFHNRIFVFTPTGDVIDLPEGSTPVDFAFHIHTEVGNTCTGARINDKIVSLKTILHSGDVVDIFTDKNRKGPSEDWLEFVKTNTARSRIKSFIKKQNRGFGELIKNMLPRR